MKTLLQLSSPLQVLKTVVVLVFTCILFACSGEDDVKPEVPDEEEAELYFPPIQGSEWETTPSEELGWNETQFNELFTFLEENNTRAFIILKNGKIVIEKYWGNTITGTSTFNTSSQWYWASAGKSLTATLVGIAQQEGLLDINDKTSDYLGEGWSSMPLEKENLITIRNQLSMTTGLDYEVSDIDCTEPSCLLYKNDAGSQWYYHNAPYTLLEQVIENASGISYNTYTNQKLESTIGMKGQWISQGYNNVYWSSPRDMARFGLLILNKGKWKNNILLSDENYYNQMLNSSQDLNPSYGFLWWLNGKASIIIPGLPLSLNFKLANQAPDDLVAAMGKNGQILDIVPSQNLVVVRMGDAPDSSLISLEFHNQMWARLALAIE